MQGLATIIIPCYNAQNTILDTLKSISNQTYINIEILAVNDGSTDKTLEILNDYAKTEKRLKVLDKVHSGVSKTRNFGMQQISGKCFCFIDADDIFESDYIESAMKEMDENTFLVSCNFLYHKRNDGKKPNKKGKTNTYSGLTSLYNVLSDKSHFVIACNKLYRTDLLNGLTFNEKLFCNEDIPFNIAYANQNCKKYNSKHMNKQFYHYHITKGSLSSLSVNKEKLDKAMRVFDVFSKFKAEICDEKFVSHLQSWEFLLCLQYIFYAYKLKDRGKFIYLTNLGKKYKKDYKMNKKNYSSFRRIGLLIFNLEKLLLHIKK